MLEITSNRDIARIGAPHELADVDFAIVRASFAVAETGSVLLSDRELRVNDRSVRHGRHRGDTYPWRTGGALIFRPALRQKEHGLADLVLNPGDVDALVLSREASPTAPQDPRHLIEDAAAALAQKSTSPLRHLLRPE